MTVVGAGGSSALSQRVPARQRAADAALHATAMVLMVVGMVASAIWTPVLLAALWCAQAAAAVLLRSGWRVQGAFVDLIAVSASLAVPFAVGHGHGGASDFAATTVAVVVAAWLLARWHVGVGGQVERVGFVTMGVSMVVMLALHIVSVP